MRKVSRFKNARLSDEFFFDVFNVTEEKRNGEHSIDYVIAHFNGDECLTNTAYADMHKASVRDAELAAISEDSPLEDLHF